MKVLDLISRLNALGIKVSLKNEKLCLGTKGERVSDTLLKEVNAHKEELVEYLRTVSNRLQPFNDRNFERFKIEDNGGYYYEVTPQLRYWLDDRVDIDFKRIDRVHGTVVIAFEILGNFDCKVFEWAVSYVISRHESLRSTFHEKNGRFYINVRSTDSPDYAVDFVDLTTNQCDKDLIDQLINFSGHQFLLHKGPVFLSRLIKIENERFFVTMKVHHVIFDSWSEQILLRDLFVAYGCLLEQRKPELPQMDVQLKDYLLFRNAYTLDNSNNHRQYWKNLYPLPPKKLSLPYARREFSPPREMLRQTERFSVRQSIVKNLTVWAKQFGVSLFVILEAALKSFLFQRTGEGDLCVGTFVFGRELSILQEQIGCYAKTVLIRTILAADDTFYDIVEKEKKAFNDTMTYDAVTLIEVLKELGSNPSTASANSFWKINLLYNDHSRDVLANVRLHDVARLNFEFSRISTLDSSHIAIDIMLQFVLMDDKLHLNVHYDTSKYDRISIMRFVFDYFEHMERATS